MLSIDECRRILNNNCAGRGYSEQETLALVTALRDFARDCLTTMREQQTHTAHGMNRIEVPARKGRSIVPNMPYHAPPAPTMNQ